jgi:ATP-dependent Clp protease ATP-binding subunit ClpA
MTSNAGAIDVAKGQIGIAKHANEAEQISCEALKRHFAPEFLNRIDAVVTFRRLGQNELLMVVQKYMDELKMKLQKQNIYLEADYSVLQFLLDKGYKPEFGARPLARTIDEYLKKPLVDDILFGKLAGGGRVKVRLDKSSLVFDISPLNPLLAIESSSQIGTT